MVVRFGALYALLLGCSSQSIEAVGNLSCLAAPQHPGCGGVGGNPSTGGASGVASGGAVSGGAASGGAASGGVASGGVASGGVASGGVASGGVAGAVLNAGAPGAGESAGSLIHRYTFDGTGTVAVDVVGGADGSIVNAMLDGAGAVSVTDDRVDDNQAADQFVDLPNQLISGLRSVTLEAWVTWAGGGTWQRVFDFGDDTSGVDGSRRTFPGKTYLFLTPQTAAAQDSVLRVSYASERVHEIQLNAMRALPRDVKTHVAVVVDSEPEQMLLYLNGELENSMPFPAGYLALIHDVNNWLGRSNFFYDPGFTGTFHEFRVYSAALNAAELRATFAAGSEATVPGL